MDLDQILAQPPAPVRDEGFSQRVTLMLYRRRHFRRNVVFTAGVGMALAALIIMPASILVRETVLQLTSLVSSPFIPWLGAGAATMLLAFQPRLLRL